MATAPPRTRCSMEKHAFGKLSLENSSGHHSLPSEKEAWSRAALGVRALSLRAREWARQVEAEAQCQSLSSDTVEEALAVPARTSIPGTCGSRPRLRSRGGLQGVRHFGSTGRERE